MYGHFGKRIMLWCLLWLYGGCFGYECRLAVPVYWFDVDHFWWPTSKKYKTGVTEIIVFLCHELVPNFFFFRVDINVYIVIFLRVTTDPWTTFNISRKSALGHKICHIFRKCYLSRAVLHKNDFSYLLIMVSFKTLYKG